MELIILIPRRKFTQKSELMKAVNHVFFLFMLEKSNTFAIGRHSHSDKLPHVTTSPGLSPRCIFRKTGAVQSHPESNCSLLNNLGRQIEQLADLKR